MCPPRRTWTFHPTCVPLRSEVHSGYSWREWQVLFTRHGTLWAFFRTKGHSPTPPVALCPGMYAFDGQIASIIHNGLLTREQPGSSIPARPRIRSCRIPLAAASGGSAPVVTVWLRARGFGSVADADRSR